MNDGVHGGPFFFSAPVGGGGWSALPMPCLITIGAALCVRARPCVGGCCAWRRFSRFGQGACVRSISYPPYKKADPLRAPPCLRVLW